MGRPVFGPETPLAPGDSHARCGRLAGVYNKSERTPLILMLGECQELVPEFAGETMKNVGSWHHLVRRKRICDYSMGEKNVLDILR